MSEARRTILRAIDVLVECETRLEYNDSYIEDIFGKFTELQFDTYDLLGDESEFQSKFIIEFLDEKLDFSLTIDELESIEYEDDEDYIEEAVDNALDEINFECHFYNGVEDFIQAIGNAIGILDSYDC